MSRFVIASLFFSLLNLYCSYTVSYKNAVFVCIRSFFYCQLLRESVALFDLNVYMVSCRALHLLDSGSILLSAELCTEFMFHCLSFV